ncbi:alpha-ketoglutarate-dependent dioxygenase AlkB family protein [Mucilaginibacter ginkgonis]|uniref:Alpha-ketoglutarate-dependent dioxygenase AlkB n=1 Tax=Mucilaginibacter ginkgonis TaxID=2682091 RepID=A0A6I4I2I9_9SPHI|nr:alpha-ketoglutarate-dependent dioxygenase AlkB [Mucilaginibacter ginkgonis]QQL50753.1 alpha-ketoglutarate-dependent dioxygenase AlkB [Mucilaginibacter ginkgonis]
MSQMDIFGASQKREVLPGLLDYLPGFITAGESADLLQHLINTSPWTQRSVIMYGKAVLTPRLTAWFGDRNIDPVFNGDGLAPHDWTPELLSLKERVEVESGIEFNSVLLNYYRDGNDSVSWHDDRDGLEGRNKFVVSLSLGATRSFDIRRKDDHAIKYSIPLESGSYLFMKNDFQKDWQHRIAKSVNIIKPRINLTFRVSKTV